MASPAHSNHLRGLAMSSYIIRRELVGFTILDDSGAGTAAVVRAYSTLSEALDGLRRLFESYDKEANDGK
jgi:hypothetical protein